MSAVQLLQKLHHVILLIVLAIIDENHAVTFPKPASNETPRYNNYHTKDEEFGVCLRSDDPLVPCLTSSMVQSIEAASEVGVVHIDSSMKLVQDPDHEKRYPTGDPREAHTLLEAITMYMEPRYLHWDLSDVFPGLTMRVGPTARGFLQFFLDKRKMNDDRSLSTGRLIMKRTILPVLLGVKLNIAALVPLIIAAIIFLVKKALVVSKLSLIMAAVGLYLNYRRYPSYSESSSSTFGGSGSFGGGGGLGSFAGPKKHFLIERPIKTGWFGREEEDPEQPESSQ